jgi:hypothetical protein
MSWEKSFQKGKELVLATCSKKAEPNANITLSLGFMDNKLIIGDCQMHTTIDNLKENSNITIVSGYLRIKGKVSIDNKGKYFGYVHKSKTTFFRMCS